MPSELHATSLCHSQGSLGPLGDHVSLVLGDCREDVDRQPVRHGHIDRNELDATLHQTRDEVHIASQAIELSDYQGSLLLPAGFKRYPEPGARGEGVPALSGLHLRELPEHLPAAAVQVVQDRVALGVEPETAPPLVPHCLRRLATFDLV
jgi:hypothetical protein